MSVFATLFFSLLTLNYNDDCMTDSSANCSLFLTSGEPDITHRLQGSQSCCSRMRCHGNMFNSMVTKPVVTGTCSTEPLASNGRSL
jgi:hypothetical protein